MHALYDLVPSTRVAFEAVHELATDKCHGAAALLLLSVNMSFLLPMSKEPHFTKQDVVVWLLGLFASIGLIFLSARFDGDTCDTCDSLYCRNRIAIMAGDTVLLFVHPLPRVRAPPALTHCSSSNMASLGCGGAAAPTRIATRASSAPRRRFPSSTARSSPVALSLGRGARNESRLLRKNVTSVFCAPFAVPYL